MTLTSAPLNVPLPPQARAVTLSHLLTPSALIPTTLHLQCLAPHCPQLFIVVTSDLPEATGLTANGALVVLKDISDRSPFSVVHFPPRPIASTRQLTPLIHNDRVYVLQQDVHFDALLHTLVRHVGTLTTPRRVHATTLAQHDLQRAANLVTAVRVVQPIVEWDAI